MAVIDWAAENKKYALAIKGIKIPDEKLTDVLFVVFNSNADFDSVPMHRGCYWIWTNEPVIHTLHKNKMPSPFDNGQIIYNGIADGVANRVRHHLMNTDIDSGWSGISLDIYSGKSISHRKKCFAPSDKVPYIESSTIAKRGSTKKGITKGDSVPTFVPIRSKEILLSITLSKEEKEHIQKATTPTLHFRNGINIFDSKHKSYEYRAYYISDISPLYMDFIEKKWRELYGLPRLCSYSSGR
jgi:hypothetical protein